jgi:hypothetical protein
MHYSAVSPSSPHRPPHRPPPHRPPPHRRTAHWITQATPSHGIQCPPLTARPSPRHPAPSVHTVPAFPHCIQRPLLTRSPHGSHSARPRAVQPWPLLTALFSLHSSHCHMALHSQECLRCTRCAQVRRQVRAARVLCRPRTNCFHAVAQCAAATRRTARDDERRAAHTAGARCSLDST